MLTFLSLSAISADGPDIQPGNIYVVLNNKRSKEDNKRSKEEVAILLFDEKATFFMISCTMQLCDFL